MKTKGKERGYVERENNNKKVAEYLEAVLADKMTAREAAFKISAMGLPLPRVLEIELSKGKDQGGEPEEFTPISEEELEKRAADCIIRSTLDTESGINWTVRPVLTGH